MRRAGMIRWGSVRLPRRPCFATPGWIQRVPALSMSTCPSSPNRMEPPARPKRKATSLKHVCDLANDPKTPHDILWSAYQAFEASSPPTSTNTSRTYRRPSLINITARCAVHGGRRAGRLIYILSRLPPDTILRPREWSLILRILSLDAPWASFSQAWDLMLQQTPGPITSVPLMYTRIIALGRAGRPRQAQRDFDVFFSSQPHLYRGPAIIDALIQAWTMKGHFEKARDILGKLKASTTHTIYALSYIRLLEAHVLVGEMEEAERYIWSWLRPMGLSNNKRVWNILLKGYLACIPSPSRSLERHQDGERVIQRILTRMHKEGVVPNDHIYTTILGFRLTYSGGIEEELGKLQMEMAENGHLHLHPHTYAVAMGAAIRQQNWEQAHKYFNLACKASKRMESDGLKDAGRKERNRRRRFDQGNRLAMLNHLISGYSKAGEWDKAEEIRRRMREDYDDLAEDAITWEALGCGRDEPGVLLDRLIQEGLPPLARTIETEVARGVHAYVKEKGTADRIEEARKVGEYYGLPLGPRGHGWILDALSRQGKGKEADEVYLRALEEGQRPTRFMLRSLLLAHSHGREDEGIRRLWQIVGLMRRYDLGPMWWDWMVIAVAYARRGDVFGTNRAMEAYEEGINSQGSKTLGKEGLLRWRKVAAVVKIMALAEAKDAEGAERYLRGEEGSKAGIEKDPMAWSTVLWSWTHRSSWADVWRVRRDMEVLGVRMLGYTLHARVLERIFDVRRLDKEDGLRKDNEEVLGGIRRGMAEAQKGLSSVSPEERGKTGRKIMDGLVRLGWRQRLSGQEILEVIEKTPNPILSPSVHEWGILMERVGHDEDWEGVMRGWVRIKDQVNEPQGEEVEGWKEGKVRIMSWTLIALVRLGREEEAARMWSQVRREAPWLLHGVEGTIRDVEEMTMVMAEENGYD
ncbi:hypothetical protein BJ684DRAFT_16649 [Piptocephalis cylindrospora]|uniref:Pentacotripeptide-repeat region of PRORP domain-containing protein n=1 Tax=Piptocephalis cylindrospora TaxID=1907219 RepID=A0A4P9Y557_9FUNG|nr:hypothetical protein BJ684DRAFT_16649 [Piptocephalis cylindrospora]|eukprot:RKP12910.1 hypothetical protein BJ684DRAFT_16649 [Piptocephalis cylindrospora]